jgi:hypothetical protein
VLVADGGHDEELAPGVGRGRGCERPRLVSLGAEDDGGGEVGTLGELEKALDRMWGLGFQLPFIFRGRNEGHRILNRGLGWHGLSIVTGSF